MSLREQNKRDKRQRLLAAARELFSSVGYSETTTRAIASKARVGAGTLFTYFSDKRQLLNALFLEEIDAAAKRGFAAVDPAAPLVDQLMTVFGTLYRWFDEDRALGREMISQLLMQAPSTSVEVSALTAGFIAQLAELVSRGGTSETPPMIIATSLFANYHIALVLFLSGHMADLESAERLLRSLVIWNLAGLSPQPAEE
ncbi:MAG: TetR/AcrR family transcriptional regulator [Myxococcales bacterium]|nr:TetR/AcrR family transcriptional regulator [Myxococcales bacterium]